jgi:hypothetical protein
MNYKERKGKTEKRKGEEIWKDKKKERKDENSCRTETCRRVLISAGTFVT